MSERTITLPLGTSKSPAIDSPLIDPPVIDPLSRSGSNSASCSHPGFEASFTAGALGEISLQVFDSFSDVEPLWRQLQATWHCSYYQSFDWLRSWMAHVGNDKGLKPRMVVAKALDEPIFLLPLCLHQRGPLKIAGWMSDSHTNFNAGLYSPRFLQHADSDAVETIFQRIRPILGAIDAFDLFNQPAQIEGQPNPLMALPHIESPNSAYGMRLETSFDAVLSAHNGKKKRKKFRWQTRALEDVGGAKLIVASTGEEVDRLLDASFRQLDARLAKLGVPNVFSEPGITPFFRSLAYLSLGKSSPDFLVFGLEIDGEICATLAGGVHKEHFSGCFTSISDDEYTHVSPGEMLLYLAIEDCVARGFTSLDLGRGQERYKSSWCNEQITMFDSFLPVSNLARLYGYYRSIKTSLKRVIRGNPVIWRQVKRLRSLINQ